MMQKKMKTMIGWTAVAIIVLVGGGYALFSKDGIHRSETAQQSEITDEFTGSWRGEGTTKEDYKWFVVYTFKNGTYTMTTDSAMKDNGTYVIAKRFLDGSVQMTKTSIPFQKTYDVFNTFSSDGKTVTIDGMKLYKQ